MKKILLSLLLIVLYSVLPVYSQTHSNANLIYLGLMLVDESSSEGMAKVCQQYDLIESGVEDDLQVFISKDGSKIRFKVQSTPKGNVPVVQVISKEKTAKIKDILKDAGFTESSGAYYNGSQFTHRRTKCQLSSGMHPIITFTKVYRED